MLSDGRLWELVSSMVPGTDAPDAPSVTRTCMREFLVLSVLHHACTYHWRVASKFKSLPLSLLTLVASPMDTQCEVRKTLALEVLALPLLSLDM
eukprot:1794915-Alexandrium_andersonii.AAC.1